MLIVDAYNVLHVTGVLPPRLAGIGVPGLIRLMSHSRYRTRSMTLVCDGASGGRDSGLSMGPVRVLFSGRGREADDLIEGLIDRYGRGGLTVISSDKRLRRAARRRGAESLESAAFLEHLVEDEARPAREHLPVFATEIPLDRYSVAHWMREFGFDEPPAPAAAPVQGARLPAARKVTRSKRAVRDPEAGSSVTSEGLGERLEIPRVPEVSPPEPRPPETSTPNRMPAAELSPRPMPAASSEPPTGLLIDADPVLIQALQEWRGMLTPDDLDMRRWIDGVTPLPPAERRDGRSRRSRRA